MQIDHLLDVCFADLRLDGFPQAVLLAGALLVKRRKKPQKIQMPSPDTARQSSALGHGQEGSIQTTAEENRLKWSVTNCLVCAGDCDRLVRRSSNCEDKGDEFVCRRDEGGGSETLYSVDIKSSLLHTPKVNR
jgi:hypothetical protein